MLSMNYLHVHCVRFKIIVVVIKTSAIKNLRGSTVSHDMGRSVLFWLYETTACYNIIIIMIIIYY